MVPNVSITKADFQTDVVRPSADGILAIIAPSSKGTVLQPAMYTQQRQLQTDFGAGLLVEDGAYDMAVSRKPVVVCKGSASTSGAYGTVTVLNGSSSTVTAGVTVPVDDFDVRVTFITGGTIGSPGITYETSLDGGASQGPVLALGTDNTIAVTDTAGSATGVTLDLGAGVILAGETAEVPVTGPRITNGDLPAPLEALRVTQLPWEILLVDGIDADASTVSLLDAWLSSIESIGKFRHAIVRAPMRNRAAGETEAAYRTRLQGIYSSVSTIRVCVCADGGDLVSLIRGVTQPRPTSLALAARAMSTGIEVDAAEVDLGALTGYRIVDDRGNPKYHDELLYPGLDDLKLVALRTFFGQAGAYINNPNVLSPAGSDFVYLQHPRLLNKACEISFATLTQGLSKGVRKQRKPDPNTGAVYIVEEDAAKIEGLVNTQLARTFAGKVSGLKFTLSRTDDIGGNSNANLTGFVEMAALSYIKQFTVRAAFARSV